MDIILHLLHTIQNLYRQNYWLIQFICRYIPLKQWAFDDSHSPKYQEFKIDRLPLITDFRQDWNYKDIIPYYEKRYGKKIRPIARFSPQDSRFSSMKLRCPHCGNALVPKKDRKHFVLHKCINPKCPYYLHNLKKVDKKDLEDDYGKNKYRLHYIYREFTMDFFSMDLNSLPKKVKK